MRRLDPVARVGGQLLGSGLRCSQPQRDQDGRGITTSGTNTYQLITGRLDVGFQRMNVVQSPGYSATIPPCPALAASPEVSVDRMTQPLLEVIAAGPYAEGSKCPTGLFI